MTVRVLIADDEDLIRAGLRTILDAPDDIEVVGEAANGLQAVQLAQRLSPDVIVMDVRMPGLDGIEATRRILSAAAPRSRVLVLTTFDLDEYVYAALHAGASGFLLKGVPTPQLVHAVQVIARGDALIAPSVTRRLIAGFARAQNRTPSPPPQLAELTAREREVLDLMGRGLSNVEIAEALIVTATTVKTPVAHILPKLGVRDRVQAVIFLSEYGVLTPNTN